MDLRGGGGNTLKIQHLNHDFTFKLRRLLSPHQQRRSGFLVSLTTPAEPDF